VKKLAALLLAIALLPCALALPPGVTAVEYGMSTCPHCLHMKEVLARMGVPYAFIDVTLSKEDGQEYMRLYGLLVGGSTYYVPFTIFLVNGTAKLAVVGAAEPEQLEALLSKALSSPGILVATASGGNWTTSLVDNETVVSEVERAVTARTPAAGEIRLVTPFGTPLSYAEVEVVCGNATYRTVSGADGKLQLRCRSAELRVMWWRGAPLNYTVSAEVGSSVQVPSVGRVTVIVLDALGRPVPDASVNFTGRWATLIGRTSSDGALTADIPAGNYTLDIARNGKKFRAPLEVVGGQAVEFRAKLDLLFAVGNTGLGFSELALAAAIAVAALAALLAFTVKRKKPARDSEQSTPSAPEKSD
jgi:glutaredoxin